MAKANTKPRKPRTAVRHRNIRRLDSAEKRTHGWLVQVQRRNEVAIRWFTDNVYGGKRKALSAARAWRDSVLSRYSDFDHRVWRRSRKRKNNTSGIPGVGRYVVIGNRNTGRRDAFWLASWIDEQGRSRKRKFAVSCHGENQAKRLAIAERERQLLRVCGIQKSAD